MSFNFNFLNFYRTKTMPNQIQNIPLWVMIEVLNEQEVDHGYWTRKRLVKGPDGKWVRIGRLSKVYYKT